MVDIYEMLSLGAIFNRRIRRRVLVLITRSLEVIKISCELYFAERKLLPHQQGIDYILAREGVLGYLVEARKGAFTEHSIFFAITFTCLLFFLWKNVHQTDRFLFPDYLK